MARALFAAGIRAGDLVHNTFSYHLTPAGAMVESAAPALGCPVIPAGTGQTEQQLHTIADLRPVAYVGTPSFLKILLDRAAEPGSDIALAEQGAGRRRGVSRRCCAPSSARAGSPRCSATAPPISASSPMRAIDAGRRGLRRHGARRGRHPRTGRSPAPATRCAPGEVGEVVVTTLTPEYPLIRFATGDLSALLPEPSPCGRTNQRIRGWLGRADQTAKVRGMFVHPEQVGRDRPPPPVDHPGAARHRAAGERRRDDAAGRDCASPAEADGGDRRDRAGGDQAARRRIAACPQAACRTTARSSRTAGRSDRHSSLHNSSNRPNFFKPASQSEHQYRMRKVQSLQVCPPNLDPADPIGRKPRGSGSPPPEPLFLPASSRSGR